MSRLRRRFDKEVEMSRGRFGKFGGQYVPETLMNELIRLEEQYNFYKNDPAFNATSEEQRSISREKISTIPEPTRSTTASGRCFWPKKWVRRG